MKKAFLCIVSLLFLFSSSIAAQKKDRIEYLPNFDKKQLHFGYYLGLNKKTFKVSYNSFLSDLNLDDDNYLSVEESYGFNIGLIVDYKLHENINLRFEPGLSSNTKTLTYNFLNEEREVPGTYLRMPLLLKFSTNRLDNMRAFVIGGVSYDFNFSSNEKNVNDNSQGEFRMKKSNFMYEIGVGVDIYLFYFKFSPSIRGIFAINNEIVPDTNYGEPYTGPYTGVIDYFGTRGVFINFTFE
ncbi:MAG: porin family protein [Aureibaculum sp.]|nr:porin family protein [Aureibaculum sp.]